MRENVGKMRTRITPNTGTFYAAKCCGHIEKMDLPVFITGCFKGTIIQIEKSLIHNRLQKYPENFAF